MTRLEWEKAATRERVARQGSDRVERDRITRTRAIYASDAQVAELRRLGYRGRRPETAAAARAIKRVVLALDITATDLAAAKRAKGDLRAQRIAELLDRLESNYRDARRELRVSSDKQLQQYLNLAYQASRNYLERLKAKGG